MSPSIPTRVEEITAAWFSSILPGVTVKPETFKLISNVQEGVGFLSLLVRVEFEADTMKNGQPTTQKYNLIIKLLPDQSAVCTEFRDLVMEEKCDQIEIFTYQRTLPDLIAEIPALGRYICKSYFGGFQEENKAMKIPYASVLVLEDLKPLGYKTKLYSETMLDTEFAQVVDFLASLHVASKCLQRKTPVPLPEIYKFSEWLSVERIRNGHISTLLAMVSSGFADVAKLLTEQGRPEQGLAFKALEPNANKILELILAAGQNFRCAAHTDLWSHNTLVNDDIEKSIQGIDWQLMSYIDPTYDIVIFILTGLPLESLNKATIFQAFRSYFDRYEVLCSEKNIPSERSWKEMEAFFGTYAMGFAMIWMVIGCAFISHVLGASQKLIRTYELFVELGITDFAAQLLVNK